MSHSTLLQQIAVAILLVITALSGATGVISAKSDKGKKVVPLQEYAVGVSCAFDAASDTSGCTFTATGPKGKGKVKKLFVPQSLPCVDIATTDAELVHVGDNPAFASRKNKPTVTLQVPGAVSASGTATYWVEADKSLLPAVGPGLVCSLSKSDKPDDVAPTATEPATQGSILVNVVICPDDAGGEEFDWYAACAPDGQPYRFQLELASGGDGTTSASDDQGKLIFSGLEEGTYNLTLVDRNWCHAESDSVDENGGLVVSSGQQASVWIFICGPITE